MNSFPAPDTLAPYVAKVSHELAQHPTGMTVKELQRAADCGEDVVRAALDRLAFLNKVHCVIRETKKRGSPPREYRPGPCPMIVVN